MPWSRFEPGFSTHPKRLKCGPVASWLWTCSVDFCTAHHTDGILDEFAVKFLLQQFDIEDHAHLVDVLVATNSWERLDNGVSFRVHDYLDHNISAEQARRQAESSKNRYEKFMKRNGHLAKKARAIKAQRGRPTR